MNKSILLILNIGLLSNCAEKPSHPQSGQNPVSSNDTPWTINDDSALVDPTGYYADSVLPDVFMFVEQMPEPSYDINKYLAENLKYPEDALKEGISGRVHIKFIVRTDGRIDSAYVARGIFPSLNKEALRVISSMPPWKPGRQNGKAVDVYITLPVKFNNE